MERNTTHSHRLYATKCKGHELKLLCTGISHVNATKKTIDDIQVIKNWPGPSKEFSEVWKTPSKIAYRSENKNARNLADDAQEARESRMQYFAIV